MVYPDSKEAVSSSNGPDNAPASSGESASTGASATGAPGFARFRLTNRVSMSGLSWIEGFGVEALTNGVKQGGPVRKAGPQKASTRWVELKAR